MTSGFALQMLKPMAAVGIPLGDAVIVLAYAASAVMAVMTAIGVPPVDKEIALVFAATVAVAAIIGGGVGVCDIVALLGE
jgi:hypothetical protein